jgi:hypothetical protein
MVAANGDDSSCVDYYGHAEHALTTAPAGHVVIGDDLAETWQPRTCDGRSQTIEPLGPAFAAWVLG